jgi:hypothetical protein
MQQSKREGYHPGPARSEPRPALRAVNDLGGDD